MHNKKSDEPELTPEQQALEQQVDAMMDPKRPDDAPAEKVPAPKAEKPVVKAAEVSKPDENTKTAPQLSGKLRKQMAVNHEPGDVPELGPKPATVPTSPLSIDELDDLTEDIAEPETKTETKAPETTESSTKLDDTKTNEAVDDIVAHEGDVMLAVADATAASRNPKPKKASSAWKDKIKALARNKWTWIVLVVVFGILFALPATRYKLIGLIIKEPVNVTVIDSKTHTPVSNATVDVAGGSAKTDANGKAKLKTSPGHTTLTISKKYYKTSKTSLFIGFKATASKVQLQATGRQVPITITNKITGKPLSGAEIKVLGTTARTNKQGKATVVLPTTSSKAAAAVSLKGYNTSKVSVLITDQAVPANSFKLTPSGTLYFLSNLSGKVDVVKTDLGGGNRHTVLAGTGREDSNTTSLLASRDWRYLVLKARRDTPQPALYLIDTSNDKITQFDTGDGNFRLIGWQGHAFTYDITRNNISAWQANREVLKSYDADNQQLNQLDQTQAEGNASSHAYQSFLNFYILNGLVVYNTRWYGYTDSGTNYDLGSKTATIRSVQPNGQNKKDYQSFPASTTGSIQAALYEPQAAYYSVYDNATSKNSYYAYQDQSVKAVSGIDQDDINKSYPTYLLSPSGNQTFWTEFRDGKNSLFIGDTNAKNAKQIATLSNYSPYGWYSDAYTLVSKNGSELYIMPTGATGTQPFKITDYFKPAQTYSGYGYGGL